MRSEWKEFKLLDHITVKHGFAFKGEYITTEATENILLTPGNFNVGGGFKANKFKYYNSNDYPDEYVLQANDLIVTMTDLSKAGDTLGYPAKVPNSSTYKYLHNQRLGLVNLISNDLDIEYLYWLMRTKKYQRFIVNSATGSTVKHTSPSRILEYTFTAPSNTKEQKKIANILSTLDDKIELNRKMNATLEAMAQAMFKSWFVDFDPVHAKAQAKSEAELEAAAAELGISREILDLFPSAFVESEMGMIPAGWEVKPLIELINIVGGGTPKRSVDKFWDGIVPWFSVKDTPRVGDIFVVDTVEKITELGLSKSSAKLLPAGTTIITARGTVGNLALTAMPTSINQSCYGIKGKTLGELYTYFLMSSVVNDLKKNVHGAVFDTITTNTFSTISVVVPSEDLHMRFDRTVLPLLERIKSNLFEIQTLQKTRDTLLPKLLSGELDVSKIETEM